MVKVYNLEIIGKMVTLINIDSANQKILGLLLEFNEEQDTEVLIQLAVVFRYLAYKLKDSFLDNYQMDFQFYTNHLNWRIRFNFIESLFLICNNFRNEKTFSRLILK